MAPMTSQRKSKSRQGGELRRRTNIREVYRRVLVVCEGEKTEPFYFRSFRVPGLDVQVVGEGGDALSVVALALTYLSGRRRSERDFDEIWCVFDRDETPDDRFHLAFEKASRNGIRPVYSDPCFELWYLLHFQYCDTKMPRKDYCDKLTTALGAEYRKNAPHMHSQLAKSEKQADAIRNSKRLLVECTAHVAKCDGRFHGDADKPSTTVHCLVEALIKYRRP